MKKKLPFEPRSYQRDAVRALHKVERGICVAPAGSGKTIIAALSILAWCRGEQRKVAWLAHTKEQCDQARDAMDLVFDQYEIDICCYAAEPNLTGYDLVIVDECHWAGCEQVRKILRPTVRKNDEGVWVSACTVWGFTATPERQDGVDITKVIGPIVYTVSREQVMENSGVLPATVNIVGITLEDDFEEKVTAEAEGYYTRNLKWADQKNGNDDQWKRCVFRAAKRLGVTECDTRNEAACLLAFIHNEDSVLILVETKAQGKWLEERIEGSVMVHSGVSKRAQKLEQFKAGDIRVLIATSLADEGFDAPIASVLVMAGCGKSPGKMIQRTGRVLRPYPGKTRGIIYDFMDKSQGMLKNQSYKRMRIYRETGYVVKDAEFEPSKQEG